MHSRVTNELCAMCHNWTDRVIEGHTTFQNVCHLALQRFAKLPEHLQKLSTNFKNNIKMILEVTCNLKGNYQKVTFCKALQIQSKANM